MLNNGNNIQFPSQKKSTASKTPKWRKECVDGAEALAIWGNDTLRQSYYNKLVNFNLYSDILDQADIERTCNPHQLGGLTSPAKMQNYPICNPKIDLLVGESIKRRFDFKVRAMNADAVSEKEEELKGKLIQIITEDIKNESSSEEEMAEKMKKFQNYVDFDYQSIRERNATQILTYLYKHLRLEVLFAKGMKDALISAEEIYSIDIIAGEPVVKKENVLNVSTVRSGESNKIDDSDIIVISGYMSPGQILDDYHDELKPKDITMIENDLVGNSSGESAIDIGKKPDLALKLDDTVSAAFLENDTNYGSTFDGAGNIRVVKAYWKSMRKIKKVKSLTEEGEYEYNFQDENYKIDESKGEEETVLWVSEWWEGHKIGGGAGDDDDVNAIYVRLRPKPVQFRSMENPSKCHPGIVGTVYNTNSNLGVSLMDRMKPYQYLYNILAYNSELMIAKNKGKIMRLGLHEVPEGWAVDKWLSMAESMNVAVYDAFKEGNKGASQGKVAGAMNAQSPVIDMEMGNSIQLYMNMMSFIKQELGEIAGVSAARQGQIQSREAVGNVEREVSQSSHITEYWFMEHDQVKIRVMECLLQTAKYAWKDNKNKKVQYILDDGSNVLMNLDGQEFNEAEFGLLITDGAGSHELMQTMKQLAHAGIQNGVLNYTQLIDIFSTESISSIRKKLTRTENEKQQRDQQNEERQQKMQQEALAMQAEEQEKARDFVREEWDREDGRLDKELSTKIEVESMRQDNEDSRFYDGGNDDGGGDAVSLAGLQLQADKINKDFQLKKSAQSETVRHNKKTEAQKEKEIAIKKAQPKGPKAPSKK